MFHLAGFPTMLKDRCWVLEYQLSHCANLQTLMFEGWEVATGRIRFTSHNLLSNPQLFSTDLLQIGMLLIPADLFFRHFVNGFSNQMTSNQRAPKTWPFVTTSTVNLYIWRQENKKNEKVWVSERVSYTFDVNVCRMIPFQPLNRSDVKRIIGRRPIILWYLLWHGSDNWY